MRKYDRLAKCSISGDRVVLNYENGENVSLVVRDIASVSCRKIDKPLPFGLIFCIVLIVLAGFLTRYGIIDLYLHCKVLFFVIVIWGIIWGSNEKRDGVILETTGGNQIFFCLKKGAGTMEIVNEILDKKSFPNSEYFRADLSSRGLVSFVKFMRSYAPDMGPFVEVGDKILIGDVLCKLQGGDLNQGRSFLSKSNVTGTVVKILVDDNAWVEDNQPLFLIQLDTTA
jgi:hypothetical protein